jgi:uncharacterized protein (DUF924 family)
VSVEASAPADPAWVDEVVRFWLEETPPEARFKRSDALDAEIRSRFLALYERLAAEPVPVPVSARHALAVVIVLDQFSRNMFRGSGRAFAADDKARDIAGAAIAAGLDRGLERDARLFLYLPFEHSESLADQDLAVSLIADLGDGEYDRYAIAHRDIIRRFGRFPHRNAALGRTSTAEEAEFLRQPGSSF